MSHQGSSQGIYQISDPINGKQSWTSGWTAIWYGQGKWDIGDLEYIGTGVCGIYAHDDYGGLDDDNNQWEYWYFGNGWTYAGANDVSIDCTSKN